MKLRSGKILGKKEFPTALQTELDSDLEDFKKLFADYKEVAREVLNMITDADSFNTVYQIKNILQDAEIHDEHRALGGTCGSLVGLVIGDHNFYVNHNIAHIYHKDIKERILSFADTLLIGD